MHCTYKNRVDHISRNYGMYLGLCHLEQWRAAVASMMLMFILLGVKMKHVNFRFQQIYDLERVKAV